MKRLACLVALALALPCAADGPRADHTSRLPDRPKPLVRVGGQIAFIPMGNPPPGPLLNDRLVRAILLPVGSYAEQIRGRLECHRAALIVGLKPNYGPCWPFLD
jgi:hypothetical protein